MSSQSIDLVEKAGLYAANSEPGQLGSDNPYGRQSQSESTQELTIRTSDSSAYTQSATLTEVYSSYDCKQASGSNQRAKLRINFQRYTIPS